MIKKHITLGITGSIAAYKIPALIRKLKSDNIEVQILMSENAKQFVTPVTLATVSGHPVLDNQFETHIPHINLEKKSDIFVLCPLTANTIGKMAQGLANDLLTSSILATRKPILMVPAMNTEMWQNKIVQENIKKLLTLKNFYLLDPDSGNLACGDKGKGRMPDFETIILETKKLLSDQKLKGKKVLIPSGPTREHLDPVRFITNGSSGLMGKVLAEEAYVRGADVKIITGPTSQKFPRQIKSFNITSAKEMEKEVEKHFSWCDIFISVAAVSDYTPLKYSSKKMKKSESSLIIQCKKTTDILKKIGRKKGKKILIGFAIESENLEKNAMKKLKEKKLDLIIGNTVESMGDEFSNTLILDKKNTIKDLKKISKKDLSLHIFNQIEKIKV